MHWRALHRLNRYLRLIWSLFRIRHLRCQPAIWQKIHASNCRQHLSISGRRAVFHVTESIQLRNSEKLPGKSRIQDWRMHISVNPIPKFACIGTSGFWNASGARFDRGPKKALEMVTTEKQIKNDIYIYEWRGTSIVLKTIRITKPLWPLDG